jgi:transcriptional regulator with XRE-family HTH domain
MKWDGEKQRQQRERKKFTLEELGDKCKVTGANLGSIERNGTQPNVCLAIRIAEVLDKPVKWFINI